MSLAQGLVDFCSNTGKEGRGEESSRGEGADTTREILNSLVGPLKLKLGEVQA